MAIRGYPNALIVDRGHCGTQVSIASCLKCVVEEASFDTANERGTCRAGTVMHVSNCQTGDVRAPSTTRVLKPDATFPKERIFRDV